MAAQVVDAAAIISPYEDVRGYLQQTLLPILSPTIEELLHHVHASGELQRVLREKAEAERRAMRRNSEALGTYNWSRRSSGQVGEDTTGQKMLRRNSEVRSSKDTVGTAGASPGGDSNQDPAPGTAGKERRRPSISPDQEAAPAAFSGGATPSGATHFPEAGGGFSSDVAVFDPLAWLSEKLRQSARGPTNQYRDQIRLQVIKQIAAVEAAEQAERERIAAEEAAAHAAIDEGDAAKDGAEGDAS